MAKQLDLALPQAAATEARPHVQWLGAGAVVLRGFSARCERALVAAIDAVTQVAPFRHMVTPGGRTMSIGLTNCGALGWVADRAGYRYSTHDPVSGRPWPPLPAAFGALAREATTCAGFVSFEPDACLINRYAPGARLTLHQDKNERDFSQPIVSISLGLPALFLFGGDQRSAPTLRVLLQHGDVMVWGGASRLRYHGVLPLKDGVHPLLGSQRLNLTLRRAG